MNQNKYDDLALPANAAASSISGPDEHAHKDHFLRLMLYQPSDVAGASRPFRHADHAARPFAPLRQSTPRPGYHFRLGQPGAVTPVRLDSPALEVMTDLRRVGAVTIDQGTTVDNANLAMITRKVRALVVVDDARQVLGLVTATDILGERPIKFAQQRGVHHHDVVVRDIMTPADSLEILELGDVQHARVGDIVATLKRAGRQHALAVETVAEPVGGEMWLRGIFSLTQIARQLGISPQPNHDLPRTFAEIEAIVGP
jgi:CBS domain-containing protein